MEEYIVGGIALVLLLAAVRWILGIQVLLIPEDERWLVYRLGRFHRLAGPGVTCLTGRIEQVERVLDARSKPREITISNLHAFGQNFGYTLRLWYRVDPQESARGDQALMRQLTLMREAERFAEIKVELRRQLMRGIHEFTRGNHQSHARSATQRLLTLAPDQVGAQVVLDELLPELPQLLRDRGAILVADQPVIIKQIHLDELPVAQPWIDDAPAIARTPEPVPPRPAVDSGWPARMPTPSAIRHRAYTPARKVPSPA